MISLAFINVGRYVVPQENREKFLALSGKISDHVKKSPLLSKSIKSRRLFSMCFGGEYGEFFDVWEFGSWTDYDNYLKSYENDPDWSEFWREFMVLVDQSSHRWVSMDEVP